MPTLDPTIREQRLRGFARGMRSKPTEPERRLWALLRDRRLADHKFRRQAPLGPFIVDFVCYEAQLVLEVDGSQHGENADDQRRDAELARRGFHVMRIWNNELTRNRAGVLEAIYAALSEAEAPPSSALRAPSPIEGEGLTERR